MKIVLIGDTQVGKTSIVTRLVKGKFEDNCSATIGAALQSYSVNLETGLVSLQIWDTAGQERFRSLAPMYYRTANVAILVFDLTKQDTLENLEMWVKDVADKGPQGMKIVIVGNKCDLVDQRCIDRQSGEQFCESNGCCFYTEVSAKSGEGIHDLFYNVAKLNETDLRGQPLDLIEVVPAKENEESSSCC